MFACFERSELGCPSGESWPALRVASESRSKSDRLALARVAASRAIFSSPSRFLLPLGDQSGPSAIVSPDLDGGGDLGCLPVEEEVAERRPDHRGAGLGQHVEVGGVERDAVDAGERVGDRPAVRSATLRARKWSCAASLVPSLRWRSRQLCCLSRLRNLSRSLASTSAMWSTASGSFGVVGLLDVADDAAVVVLDPGVAREREPLAGGRAGDQAFRFDVADDRRHVGGCVREHLHRAGDQLAVGVALRPLVAVVVLLRDVPELQRVVAEVVVQVDQARVDRPMRVERLHALEAGGLGRLRLGPRRSCRP